MKQGEIYLVQYDPSVGYEYKKTRPAIILSSEKNLKESNLVTVMAITGNTESPISDDILIRKDSENRLISDSLIKAHHISSFDKSRMIKYIGIVSDEILRKIKHYLKIHFDL